jgi:DUF971 family protein
MNRSSSRQPEQLAALSRNLTVREELIVWDQEKIVIMWADGHRSCFSWLDLRLTCPCAICQQARTTSAPERDAA